MNQVLEGYVYSTFTGLRPVFWKLILMVIHEFDEWPHLLKIRSTCDGVRATVPRDASTLFKVGRCLW